MESSEAQRIEQLKRFAHLVAHDLKEPLRAIEGLADLTVGEYSGKLNARGADYLRRISASANQLRAMVDGLLLLAETESGSAGSGVSASSDALKNALGVLAAQIDEANATVSFCELPKVQVAPAALETVFRNLISNALRYRGEESLKIAVTAAREGDLYRFGVQDNGIGFQQKKAEKIFQPFQRLKGDEGTATGTGFGLAFCKSIVEGAGGTIWAESKPGAGSSFFFTLPTAT